MSTVAPSDPDCVFCQIVGGQVPCFTLYENAATLAVMDINPVHDGHCLIISKAHHPTVFVTPPDVFAEVARTAARIAAAIERTLTPDGVSLVQANGLGAAQSVPHLHMHVLPRRMGDGLALNWTPRPGDMERIGDLAARLRTQI